ncbi:MAG: protoporphyrinogen oxidase [Halobacteriaceae archaeon]
MSQADKRVGVVGAGITGLSLVHYLTRGGVDVTAFEADEEPGGVINSKEVNETVIEVGPQRLRLTDQIREMINELNINEELLLADDDLPLYVYSDGRLRIVPRSIKAFLATDLLSWSAKLRLLKEPFTEIASPSESAKDMFVRKFGSETYENLIEPVFGGTYGSDPAEMPVRHSLRSIQRIEQKHGNLLKPAIKRFVSGSSSSPPATFRKGLQRLPSALAEEYSDQIQFGSEVTSVRPVSGGATVEIADGTTEEFDEVILTTPAQPTASIVESISQTSANALRELNYNPIVLAYLSSPANVNGFGYQVRRSEPLRTLGVTWNASLFNRDNIFTAFLGGMYDPEILDLPEERIGQIATREFKEVMNESASVIRVEKLPDCLPAHDDTWDGLERVDLPDNIQLATNYTSRMGIPSRVRESQRLAQRIANGQDKTRGSHSNTA